MRVRRAVAAAALVIAACAPAADDGSADQAAALPAAPAPPTSDVQLPALAPLERPVRVLPLGDSITEGFRGAVTYRWFLWQLLADGGYEVDFVGNRRGAFEGRPRFADFDQDHEGHWGWHANRVADNVERWARRSRPDVALVHLGTNDVAGRESPRRTADDVVRVVEGLRRANPQVVVLLAAIIPLEGREQKVATLNEELRTRAAELFTPSSPVFLVDHFSDFDAEVGLDVDGIHPTAAGELRMALRWFAVLAPVLDRLGAAGAVGPPVTTSPTPAPSR